MIVRVYRQSRRSWVWECHWCHCGDVRNTQPDALTEGRDHLRVHFTFGFRPAVPR